MRALISILPLLACPALMFLCMRGMMKMSADRNDQTTKMDEDSRSSESQLRQEVSHLREELSELRAQDAMSSEHQEPEDAVGGPVSMPAQN